MTKKNKKKLVVLDAHAILHRAYHALPDFKSPQGEPTGGLYGLISMLLKIITDLKPDYIVATYDLPEPTFRKQVYEAYKAGRAKTDDDLIAQLIRSRDIFTAFNIPIYDSPSFEADDIIGTIVAETRNQADLQVIIASGDMDTLQLVQKNEVVVYTLKRGLNDTILYNEQAVIERFGFKPELLVDFKGLRGDPSDNIIGIAGIGEKTATTLIKNFGSIEKIYQQLTKSEETFLQAGFKPRIINLLKNGEEEALFSKTLATIRQDAPITFKLPTEIWPRGLDFDNLSRLLQELGFKSLLERVRVVLTPVKNREEIEVKKIEPNDLSPADKQILLKAKIALWLLESDQTNATIEDIFNFSGQTNLVQALDFLERELKNKNLETVYRDIEIPLIPILDGASNRGLLIDVSYFKKLGNRYHQKLSKLTQKIYELAGREFNINSPKQLGVILFDELKIPVTGLKKTSGGARSTRESELQKLNSKHEIIGLILQQRELQKLVSTYIDVIPNLVDDNQRLHSVLHQTGTTTGRMSSSDPNLQNIPASEIAGQEIREGFKATLGHLLLTADYSQIELRVLAILSKDKDLAQIFMSNQDVHQSVAEKIFKVKGVEVTKDMRRKAKVINFGIIYGMGINALKANLGTTRDQAEEFYNNYFATFPTIKNYFDEVITSAYKLGYTETYFGRRRYFPDLQSKLPYLRSQAERGVTNAPLQGTAADIVKLAMIKIDQNLKQTNLINHCHLLLQVHDELIYEVEKQYIAEVEDIVKTSMEAVLNLKVPLLVNLETGLNWGNLQ